MRRTGFAEAYYDSFTGAQQSMSMLIENAESTFPVLITPKHGKCVKSISDETVNKKIIEYPDRLDKFEGKLLNGGVIHKSSIGAHLLWYYLNVAKELYRLDLDILYCNNLRTLMLFGPPAKALGIPVIWYVRIDTPTPRLDVIGLQIADEVVTISDGVRQRFDGSLLKGYKNRIRTIYTGVDLELFDPKMAYRNRYDIDPDPLTIVEIASIHPRKGQDKLIDALSRIQDDLPEFQVVFAGSVSEGQKEYSERLHNQIYEAGLEDEVTFLGWCDDVRAVLSHTDFFVLPSENEGLPRSILEASAMGVPTIATPAGGTAELLQHEQTGLIVPMNDVEELGNAIRRLALDSEFRRSCSVNARSLVEKNFSKAAYVANFEQLIDEMLSPQ